MVKNHHTNYLVAAAIFALATMAGGAWACSAQSSISLLPRSAPARTQISAAGDWASVQAPVSNKSQVEIRWNATDGPRVDVATTLEGNEFTSQVVVPEVAPGVYYIVAVADGQKISSAPFEVTLSSSAGAAGTRGESNDLWSAFNAQAAGGIEGDGRPEGAAASKAGAALGAAMLALGAVGLLLAPVVVARRTGGRARTNS
ncbi:MAG: hypothetical protein ACRDIU_03750 [Actinomycetota bacterium]